MFYVYIGDSVCKFACILVVDIFNPLIYCSQGMAIGKCPKDKLFRGYIDLEIQLREFHRCRILYEKFLEFSPENCTTWMKVIFNE